MQHNHPLHPNYPFNPNYPFHFNHQSKLMTSRISFPNKVVFYKIRPNYLKKWLILLFQTIKIIQIIQIHDRTINLREVVRLTEMIREIVHPVEMPEGRCPMKLAPDLLLKFVTTFETEIANGAKSVTENI